MTFYGSLLLDNGIFIKRKETVHFDFVIITSKASYDVRRIHTVSVPIRS